MLQNAYLLAKIGADTAENEQHLAKNLRKTDYYPTGHGRRESYSLLNNVPGADAVGDDGGPLGRLVSNILYTAMFFLTPS